MTATPAVLATREGGLLRLTMNQPDKRNALGEAMLAGLQAAFDAATDDPRVRVIVLAAAGPVFCSGHDLKQMTARRGDADRGRAYFDQVMTTCSRLMQTIVRHPKPVIAEVQGTATAAGCQLVASCDLAIAADHARFCTPGVHIGLFCSTPMVALSRNLGRKHAMEMLLTGDMIAAERAAEMGLVNRVVAAAELTAATTELATRIAAKSGRTLKIGKQAFYAQAEMPLAEAYDFAARVMVDNMLIPDAEEGIQAFIEKRPAQWQGG